MNTRIQVHVDERFNAAVDGDRVARLAGFALDHRGILSEAGLTVVITGDEELHRLNREYLDDDRPTDVLAFPSGDFDPDTGRHYLGDVLISFPRATAQAIESGHAVQDELNLLIVHGVLHLLGYVHDDPAGQERMWAVQNAILKRFEKGRPGAEPGP